MVVYLAQGLLVAGVTYMTISVAIRGLWMVKSKRVAVTELDSPEVKAQIGMLEIQRARQSVSQSLTKLSN